MADQNNRNSKITSIKNQNSKIKKILRKNKNRQVSLIYYTSLINLIYRIVGLQQYCSKVVQIIFTVEDLLEVSEILYSLAMSLTSL